MVGERTSQTFALNKAFNPIFYKEGLVDFISGNIFNWENGSLDGVSKKDAETGSYFLCLQRQMGSSFYTGVSILGEEEALEEQEKTFSFKTFIPLSTPYKDEEEEYDYNYPITNDLFFDDVNNEEARRNIEISFELDIANFNSQETSPPFLLRISGGKINNILFVENEGSILEEANYEGEKILCFETTNNASSGPTLSFKDDLTTTLNGATFDSEEGFVLEEEDYPVTIPIACVNFDNNMITYLTDINEPNSFSQLKYGLNERGGYSV